MRKLLLILVCLYAITGIVHARQNYTPPPLYPEYKTAVHTTCANVKFKAFNIDKSNNYVYAIDTSGDYTNVYSINRAGACRKLGQINKNWFSRFGKDYIAIDAKRKYGYVEDDNKLIQFNIGTGKLVRRITIPYLDSNCKIETDKYGNIYTLNPDKALIHKVSPTGSLLLTFGGKGSYDGKFNNPQALAIDKNNYIYVADSDNYRIQKFNSAGNFVAKWGSRASDENDIGPYEFQFPPYAIGVDANSNVYVFPLEGTVLCIKKYHSNDDYIGKFEIQIPSSIYNRKVDGYGNSYTLDYGTIVKVNKYGQLVDAWGGGYGKYSNLGFSRGAHQNLKDMVFDRQNNMYTFDSEKCLIQKFSKYGKYIRQWGGFSAASPLPIGKIASYSESSMAINSLDETYITASYRRINRYDRNGKLLQTFEISRDYNHIYSIATDKYNNVYVLYLGGDYGSTYFDVTVYTRTFDKIRTIHIETTNDIHKQLSHDLDIDKKRNILYVRLHYSVKKYTLTGKLLTGWSLTDYRSYASAQIVLNNGNLAYINEDTLNIYSNSGTLLKSEKLPTGTKFVKEDKFGNRYFSTDRKIYKKAVNPDIDHDGVPNERDAFPFNKREWLDTDHDGIGNNADKDDDNDGLLDTVERAHKLNPLNPRDAKADFDHDGFTNAQEINAGTNIRSAKSRPTWVPIIMGDIVTFTLPKR